MRPIGNFCHGTERRLVDMIAIEDSICSDRIAMLLRLLADWQDWEKRDATRTWIIESLALGVLALGLQSFHARSLLQKFGKASKRLARHDMCI